MACFSTSPDNPHHSQVLAWLEVVMMAVVENIAHNQKNPKTNSTCLDTYADMYVCKYSKGLGHAIKGVQML